VSLKSYQEKADPRGHCDFGLIIFRKKNTGISDKNPTKNFLNVFTLNIPT